MQHVIILWNSLLQQLTDDKSLCEFKEQLNRLMDGKSIEDCSVQRLSFLLRKSLSCTFLKIEVRKVFTHLLFLGFSLSLLILATIGNSARLGFDHPDRSEILTIAIRFWGGLFVFGLGCRNGISNVPITLSWLRQRGWNLPGHHCYPVWQVHTDWFS